MIRARYGDNIEDLHYHIEALDKNRRNAHNSVIASVNILNRMLIKELGMPEGFVQIDTTNREKVADFAATFTTQQNTNAPVETTMDLYAQQENTSVNKTRTRLNDLLDKYEDLLSQDENIEPENQAQAI